MAGGKDIELVQPDGLDLQAGFERLTFSRVQGCAARISAQCSIRSLFPLRDPSPSSHRAGPHAAVFDQRAVGCT